MGVTYLSDVLCQSCLNVDYVIVRITAWVRTNVHVWCIIIY